MHPQPWVLLIYGYRNNDITALRDKKGTLSLRCVAPRLLHPGLHSSIAERAVNPSGLLPKILELDGIIHVVDDDLWAFQWMSCRRVAIANNNS